MFYKGDPNFRKRMTILTFIYVFKILIIRHYSLSTFVMWAFMVAVRRCIMNIMVNGFDEHWFQRKRVIDLHHFPKLISAQSSTKSLRQNNDICWQNLLSFAVSSITLTSGG